VGNIIITVNSTVVSNEAYGSGITLLWLEAPEIAASARPGQFAMLKCENGTFLRRPLSIHRVSSDKTRLAFLFAIVGKGTDRLNKTRPGDCINLIGPLGNGFSLGSSTSEAILVAGGLGIAPLGFLAEELRFRGHSVKLLYGAATADIMCEGILPELPINILATEDGSRGRMGYITACLPELLSKNSRIFACGPAPMYRTMARMAELKDYEIQVSLEVRMACGLSVCYGCSVNTRQGLRQVCSQGPVFNLHDVLWDELPDI
jgi:dihydroorotate dehydrogenase electron transfer subunit